MKKQEELAMKVLKRANESTEWDFQMTNYGGDYYVEAKITEHEKGKMFVSFIFRGWYVLLKVWSPDGRYEDCLVYDKLTELYGQDAVVAEYGIYSTIFGERGICFYSPMPLEVLESQTDNIIKRLMLNMISAMAEVIF